MKIPKGIAPEKYNHDLREGYIRGLKADGPECHELLKRAVMTRQIEHGELLHSFMELTLLNSQALTHVLEFLETQYPFDETI